MWNDSNISDESDSGHNEFVESPDGTWYFGIEAFAAEVEYSQSELLQLFDGKIDLLLKHNRNSIKILSEIEADQLSCLSRDYLHRVLCSPASIIELNKAGIAPGDISHLSKNYFTTLLKRYSEVIKLISLGILFQQLKELSINNLRAILSNVDQTLTIMKTKELTFEQLAKLPLNKLRIKLTSLKKNTMEESTSSSSSFFQVPAAGETASEQVDSKLYLKSSS
jgi:hypothetical protein